MEQFDPNILSIILSYIPDDSINLLTTVIPNISETVATVKQDVLYWRQRTELLLGRQIKIGDNWSWKDWEKVYKDLQDLIKNIDPTMVTVGGRTAKVIAILHQAIIDASHYRYPKTVELLLSDKRVDPSAQNNQAI